MSEQNNEIRIAELEKKIAILGNVPNLLKVLADLGHREMGDRLQMCMTIMQLVVEVKDAHNAWVRRLADKPMLFEASERQEIIDHTARVESVFERIEKTIRDAGAPPAPPGT